MNLFSLHDKPHELDHHNRVDDIPDAFEHKHRNNLEELDKRRNAIFKKAITTLRYLSLRQRNHIKFVRFPEAEKILATDAYTAYSYASMYLHGRFKAGEPAIIANKYFWRKYLEDEEILNHGRWKELEHTLVKNGQDAYLYATLIEARFKEAEPAILHECEPGQLVHYARLCIKGRWKEAEKEILKSPAHTYQYWFLLWCNEYTKTETGEWPEGKRVMLSTSATAAHYSINTKTRHPEIEKMLTDYDKIPYERCFNIKL